MNPVLQARMQRRAAQKPEVATRFIIEGDQMHTIRTQDCTAIAERAHAMHKEGLHGSSEMKLAASIPLVIIEKYMNENGVSFAECLSDPIHARRILNNPDNKLFRIWPGQV
jgi:hypothetical protein